VVDDRKDVLDVAQLHVTLVTPRLCRLKHS